MKLIRRSDEYIILVDGAILMSSRMHGSEEALATFACQRVRTLEQPSVLIGGLGMGFTPRATLQLPPPESTLLVSEHRPALVEGNRGALGPVGRHPRQDKPLPLEGGELARQL